MKLYHVVTALVTGLSLAAGAETWKVTPGTGVGPILLNQPCPAILKVLTPTDSIGMQGGGAYLRFKEGVELEVQNQKVLQIVIHQLNFNAKSGPVDILLDGNLKMGAGLPQVEGAYGRAYESKAIPVAKGQPPITYYAYKSRGLGVRTVGGKVVEYSVWARH
ncbi:hypothetical protein IV102_26065 [bacterium]|nr:hypothetical protein [bacterium]